jgi:hypothetical protein
LRRPSADCGAKSEACLAKFSVFGRGWINRLNDVTAQALAWSDDEPVKPGQPDTPMPGEPGAPAAPGYGLPDADAIGKILAAAVPLFVQYGPAILKVLAAIAPALKPDASKPWWKNLGGK